VSRHEALPAGRYAYPHCNTLSVGRDRADPAGADLTNATALVPAAKAATAAGWSQDGEDLHAYNTYFYGLRDGIFLEMGALDGAHIIGPLVDAVLGHARPHKTAIAQILLSLSGDRCCRFTRVMPCGLF